MRSSLLLSLLLLAGCAHPAHDATVHHRFEDPQRWARVFDDPARDAWQKPDAVIAALKLAPDAKVADLGAGTGYFTVRLARAVPQGRVYAVDIEQGLVDYLGKRAAQEKLANVQPVLASPSDAKIPQPVDRILIVDTYHHIDDRLTYFRKLAGSLTPGGQVAIVDFTRQAPHGPPPAHRLPAEQVISEMRQAGYALVSRPDVLPDQYLLIFARSGASD